MNTSLVIALLATDRPGLVNVFSEILRTHHANWTDSRFARLAGKFAGVLRVSVAEQQAESLIQALLAMQDTDLQIQIEKSDAGSEQTGENTLMFEVLGQDRPGIIEDITHELVALGVNIVEMNTEQRVASMSNEILFYAELTLSLPDTLQAYDVQCRLEEMSDQLMVDLSFPE